MIGADLKSPIATVSKVTKEHRWEICNRCEFLTKNLKRCQKCGCFMKLKVIFEYATCPKGKW